MAELKFQATAGSVTVSGDYSGDLHVTGFQGVGIMGKIWVVLFQLFLSLLLTYFGGNWYFLR